MRNLSERKRTIGCTFGGHMVCLRTEILLLAVLIAVVFLCLSALAGDNPPETRSAALNIRSEDLAVQPPAANWISYNGDYSGRRFSGLAEINSGNLAGTARGMGVSRAQYKPAGGYSRGGEWNDVCYRGERCLRAGCPYRPRRYGTIPGRFQKG